MKKILYLFLLFIIAQNIKAQEIKIDFLPTGLNFLPLRANIYEPRLGVLYFPSDRSLKVDIGNSSDVIAVDNLIKDVRISMGIDFMAFGLASSYQGKRLQIDALDGFFGGNASISYKINSDEFFKVRFRIIHNSAHLVDGSYDLNTNKWKNNYSPVPYARDFIEPTFAYENKTDFSLYRVYFSPSYSVLVRPSELKRWSFNTGIEFSLDKLIGKSLSKSNNIFCAYQFSLIGVPEYTGNNNILLGLKMGEYYNKGINIYLSYYTGIHYFSEYYVKKLQKFGIGFFIDF